MLQCYNVTMLQCYKNKIARLQDCKIARLQDCKITRLHDYTITRLQDYKITFFTKFEGKEMDWTRFSLKMKAHLGAINPRYHELLKIAEDPERSLSHDDLGPVTTDATDNSSFVLTMLLKDRGMDKVELRGHEWRTSIVAKTHAGVRAEVEERTNW